MKINQIEKISQLDESLKIYDVYLINGQIFNLTGEQLFKFLNSSMTFLKVKDGGFNKNSIACWKLNYEKTREEFLKLKNNQLIKIDTEVYKKLY